MAPPDRDKPEFTPPAAGYGVDPESLDPSEEGIVSYDASSPGAARGLTPDGRFSNGRLAGLSMGAAIWVLSWPVLIESFLNSLVGLTDTALAAGLGEAETDAIAGASYIMWFLGLVVMALGVGSTALISRSIGRGRMAVARAVLGQTVVMSVIAGIVVGLMIAVGARPIAALLNMSPAAMDAFSDYMLVIAIAAPGAALLFTLTACARGAGDSRRPLFAMFVRNIVNIVVSLGLSGVDFTRLIEIDGEMIRTVVWQNPMSFDLGVTGIAIGTLAGDVVGAAIMLRMAIRGSWGVRLVARRLKPHWITIGRLWRLGLPNFLETFGLWIGNFMVIVMVGWLGVQEGVDGLLGAHVVAIRIEAFSFLPGFAMGMAAATLAGQYIGAGSPELAKRAVLRCMLIGVVVMGLMGAVFVAFGAQITGVLTQQPTHLRLVPQLLIICGVVQIPFAMAMVFRSAMRGAGDVRVVLVITWVTTYLVRLPMAYAFSGVDIPLPDALGGGVIDNPFGFDWGLPGLWIGLCAELVIRGAVFTARYAHGGWLNIKV